MTNLDKIENVKTYEDLQILIELLPELFFEHLNEISTKFPLYLITLKIPDWVIMQYVNNGLNPLDLLLTQNLTGYTLYYIRTLAYGIDKVDDMYSDVNVFENNEKMIQRYKSLDFDDPNYEALSNELYDIGLIH